MRLELIPSLFAVAGLLWGAPRAHASANVFVPFSGYNFVPADSADSWKVSYHDGRIFAGKTVVIEAALGHAAGGGNGNGFYIWGRMGGNLQPISCGIHVMRQSDGLQMGPWPNNPVVGPSGNEGRYQVYIKATPQQGAYFYTLRCTLPEGSDIGGVRPDA